nr:unnamed protein product [Callosobruchus analis]
MFQLASLWTLFLRSIAVIGQLGGNIFINVALSAIIQVPSTFFACWSTKAWGRKKTLIIANVLAGVSIFLIGFVPSDPAWIKSTLSTIGMFGLALAFPTVYIYSGELFPTVLRNIGVGTSSMCARIGSMVAPFVAALASVQFWIPPIWVCCLAGVAKFPTSWHMMSIIFIAPPIKTSCVDSNITDFCSSECPGIEYDTFGRQKPMVFAIALQSIAGLIEAFSPWFPLFVIMRFLAAVATAGTLLISFVLLMEIVGTKYRMILGCLSHIPYFIGHASMVAISYYLRDWREFQIAISAPTMVLLFYFWVLPESPRWQLSMGKKEEATRVLKKAAAYNKLPTEAIDGDITAYLQKRSVNDTEGKKGNLLDLVKTKIILRYTVLMCVCWWVSILPKDPTWLKPTFACLGIFGITLSFVTIYTYSIELFPTFIRNAAMGVTSTFARMGSMLAPFAATWGGGADNWLPPTMFSVACTVASLVCLKLPETLGKDLPETVEDTEMLEMKQTKK